MLQLILVHAMPNLRAVQVHLLRVVMAVETVNNQVVVVMVEVAEEVIMVGLVEQMMLQVAEVALVTYRQKIKLVPVLLSENLVKQLAVDS